MLLSINFSQSRITSLGETMTLLPAFVAYFPFKNTRVINAIKYAFKYAC